MTVCACVDGYCLVLWSTLYPSMYFENTYAPSDTLCLHTVEVDLYQNFCQ